ncbi:MAG TPA: DNA-3-methyladenine glycosylase [Chitinophagaceae bacterium]
MKQGAVSLANKLPLSFYLRRDVVAIARDLLGKIIVTCLDGAVTAGRIVETEAYYGAVDKASHAYGNRRTARTEVMFAEGGLAYVYLCYGIHHLFNVVTNRRDTPHAVLVRAVEPLTGIDVMMQRTGKRVPDNTLTRGPGNVSKALGIHTRHTGYSLQSDEIYIADDGYRVKPAMVAVTARIGVEYAAEDSLLPYRFAIRGNPYVSGKKIK